ncbi:ankyrin repeat domain-containing protein [Candidatus Dependentiae bacterium]
MKKYNFISKLVILLLCAQASSNMLCMKKILKERVNRERNNKEERKKIKKKKRTLKTISIKSLVNPVDQDPEPETPILPPIREIFSQLRKTPRKPQTQVFQQITIALPIAPPIAPPSIQIPIPNMLPKIIMAQQYKNSIEHQNRQQQILHNQQTTSIFTQTPTHTGQNNKINRKKKNEKPENILQKAIEQGVLSIVKQLIENKKVDVNHKYAFPNSVNQYKPKATPLSIACKSKKTDAIIKYLILAGANPNIALEGGKVALHYACKNCSLKPETIMYIIDNTSKNAIKYSKQTPFHDYFYYPTNLDVIKVFIGKWGTDILNTKIYGRTPVTNYFSNKFIDLETTKYLMKNGADITIPSRSGKTPLFFALENPKLTLEILKELTSNLSDINSLETNCLQNALHFLCKNKNLTLEIIKYFLNESPYGKKLINKIDTYDNKPVHYAIQYTSINIIKYLIENFYNSRVPENFLKQKVLNRLPKSKVKYLKKLQKKRKLKDNQGTNEYEPQNKKRKINKNNK